MSVTAPSEQETATSATAERIVNDFAIQVATVNGSGSQTANLVLLRSIFQMGVPVSGKNMFPSNIAGPADVVHDPRELQGIHRAEEGSRLPRRDERRDGEGRRDDAVARRRGRLRRAAEAERAAQPT